MIWSSTKNQCKKKTEKIRAERMFERLARKVQGVRRVRKDDEDKGKVKNGGTGESVGKPKSRERKVDTK